jgi:hypothetical protein
MRRYWIAAGALTCLLWMTPRATASEHATLTDVQYSAQAGYSRVTLLFRGEVRYSPGGSDGVVRLGLSHTGVAIPMKARRQLLNAGLVTAISVSALAGDSTTVSLLVRTGTTYRCVLPASGNALYVDVLPTGGQSALPRPSGAPVRHVIPAKPAPAKAATVQSHAPATNAVIDIPAVAREQLQAEWSSPPVRTSVQQPVHAGLTPPAALALSALVVIVLTGSGAALALLFRKKPAKAVGNPRPTARMEAPVPRPGVAERETAGRELLVDELDENDESHFAHETSLQLARSFRRGSEEITLARRLHDHSTPQLSAARMEETLARAATPNQRLHFARKLGVGRGEMELAVKLRSMRPAEKTEELGS